MAGMKINVQGIVQGVGFRYFTKRLADRYHVTGTVKNEYDGSVTIQAFASPSVLAEFAKKVKLSPAPAGQVREMTVQELVVEKEPQDFKILQYY
jgi:acylphosphatase